MTQKQRLKLKQIEMKNKKMIPKKGSLDVAKMAISNQPLIAAIGQEINNVDRAEVFKKNAYDIQIREYRNRMQEKERRRQSEEAKRKSVSIQRAEAANTPSGAPLRPKNYLSPTQLKEELVSGLYKLPAKSISSIDVVVPPRPSLKLGRADASSPTDKAEKLMREERRRSQMRKLKDMSEEERVAAGFLRRKKMFVQETKRVFDNATYLINPFKDSSEKQLFVNNGYKNPVDNLKRQLQKNDRINYDIAKKVDMPEHFGLFTKDNTGSTVTIGG